MSVEIGQVLDGKYRITRLIGQGGMGAVYEGIHTLIDRKVAIKVLLPSTDPTAAGRFEQEARAAGRIGNDHILEVLDIADLPDNSKYKVCEFLHGQPLSSLMSDKGMVSPQELTPLILQLLTGLGAAHRAEVLHRDLKPDNIFVRHEKAVKKDLVKIIYFGIS
jgi:serine/threonine-protein kinase